MSLYDNTTTKLYYSIGEVADMFGVSSSLIRFWESEFDTLRPHKNGKGDRRFTQKNIDQIRLIYTLVKDRGFTLKGAKQEIANNKARLQGRQQTLKRLKALKGYLEELKRQL